ncbi:MAG: VWA domain-containing protein [bacterium]|nr:VWA domain-containing protein [bacterium]
MIDTLSSFVGELRAVGLPVSTAEALDAANALLHIDVGRRSAVRETLAATLIKMPRHRSAFDTAFDVFFSVGEMPEALVPDAEQVQAASTGAGDSDQGLADLMTQLAGALQGGDGDVLRRAVREAVSRLSGFQPGRPVGGRYYLYRVLQRLDGIEEMLGDGDDEAGLAAQLDEDDVAALMELLRAELRREIVRRLVADRGAEPVARTLREPLAEDIDLMHATREELQRVEAAIAPLARKLATRLAQRRRRGRQGRLDLRRTIRRSLAHGGVLIEPQFRPPRRSKPEIVLLCDVSGSMATFARFTMQFTYAVGSQFSRVRSFAFIDEVDEVTGYFGPGTDFVDSMDRLSQEARIVGHDGHSDYGVVLRSFAGKYEDAVTSQSTLIVTGDARNNYRDAENALFHELAATARSMVWLNPEARRFWDTGDSVMSQYAAACDDVYEVRTLRQLEEFVAAVALPVPKSRSEFLN